MISTRSSPRSKRRRNPTSPTLIACKTTIGYGAPKRAGTSKSHGEPLGAEEIEGARKALNWPHEPFVVPQDILDAWRAAGRRGAAREAWKAKLAAMEAGKRWSSSAGSRACCRCISSPPRSTSRKSWRTEAVEVATRKASEMVLAAIAPYVPELVTGSADLTGSNNTKVAATPRSGAGQLRGRFVHWGIREHGMAAAMNGMALHGGCIPSGATFLVFADYMRPALRLAALAGVRHIDVMTHDSIGLGEDGPTHQPVEHLASSALHAEPERVPPGRRDRDAGMLATRGPRAPRRNPSVLALTRQNLPQVRLTEQEDNLCATAPMNCLPHRERPT
jgi:transketolase